SPTRSRPRCATWSKPPNRSALTPDHATRCAPTALGRNVSTIRNRRCLVPLNTIALELVPPNTDRGAEHARAEAHKVLRLSAEAGIAGRIGHVMIPGMIAE